MASLFEIEDLIKTVLETKFKNKSKLQDSKSKSEIERLKLIKDFDIEKVIRAGNTDRSVVDRRQTGATKRTALEQSGLMDRLREQINATLPEREQKILNSRLDRKVKAFDLFKDQTRKPFEDRALKVGVQEAEGMARSNARAREVTDIRRYLQNTPKLDIMNPERLQVRPLVKNTTPLLPPPGYKKKGNMFSNFFNYLQTPDAQAFMGTSF